MVAKTGCADRDARQEHGRPTSGYSRRAARARPGRPRRAPPAGRAPRVSPALRPRVTWMASAVSTPSVTVCGARPCRPSPRRPGPRSRRPRRAAAPRAGTTSAPVTCAHPDRRPGRTGRPRARARPATWTVTSNEPACAPPRAGRPGPPCPSRGGPPGASTRHVDGGAQLQPCRSRRKARARNSRNASSTKVKSGVPLASIAPGSASRFATRPAKGALISVRASCWAAMASLGLHLRGLLRLGHLERHLRPRGGPCR